jgi:long-chain fatty acid transport protein
VLYNNPAAITGLESSEFVMGLDFLQVSMHLASELGPLADETRSDSGVAALPTMAVAFQSEDSPFALGFGLFSIGGFGANYPGSTTNPILTPPTVTGVGPIYSKLNVYQVISTIGVKLTDQLSIGFSPTVVIAEAALDPDVFAPPTAPFDYPGATHARPHWGLGFHAGIYYEMNCDWRFGASYKSPQWIEDFTFFSDPPTPVLGLKADYPGIISLGGSYCGIPCTLIAVDLRYVDYKNTDLFGHGTGYDPATTAMTGLGWKSVFAISTGVQYQLNDSLSLRAGYLYTENPIADADTFFNVASSAIYQHMISVGATWQITCRTGLNIAYLRALHNSIEGPWQLPSGPLAGSLVKSREWVDALVIGLQVKF